MEKYIFVISQDSQFNRLIRVTLDISTDHKIIMCQNSQEVFDQMPKEIENIDLILYHPPSNDYRYSDLLELSVSTAKGIKILVITENDKSYKSWFSQTGPFLEVIQKQDFLSDFSELMKKALGLMPLEETDQKFKPLDFETLRSFDGLETDVFIRSKVTGHYSAIFKQGTKLTDEEFERYKARGLKTVYLPVKVQAQVVKQMEGQLEFFAKLPAFKFIFRPESDPLNKRFERKIIRLQGELLLDKEFKEQIEATILKTLEFVTDKAQLDKFLKFVTNSKSKDRFLAEHMLLLCYVTSAWSGQLGWHSKGTKDKLIMASILHDITLGGHPHLAEIEDMKEFESIKDTLSEEERRLFLEHPSEGAQLILGNLPMASHDTVEIILAHHELPNGKGFPRKINHTKMFPLLQLFILAHDFVFAMIKKDIESVDLFFEESLKKYPYQNFKKLIGQLQKVRENRTRIQKLQGS